MLYVLCYDISDDGRRTRVAALMERYGFRVQKSVFECDINAAQLGRLKKQALKMIDKSTDSLRIYRLCAACAARMEHNGSRLEPNTGDAVIV